MKKLLLIPVALLLVAASLRSYQNEADRDAVRAAVLDYVEGIYEVNPDRIERSVHPELAKRGFYPNREGNYQEAPMNYEQLHALAGRWNKDGKVDPETAPKEVIIYEVLNKTASVKLVADWGIDYMHLAKYEGKWMIVNVLWQTHPPEEDSSGG